MSAQLRIRENWTIITQGHSEVVVGQRPIFISWGDQAIASLLQQLTPVAPALANQSSLGLEGPRDPLASFSSSVSPTGTSSLYSPPLWLLPAFCGFSAHAPPIVSIFPVINRLSG